MKSMILVAALMAASFTAWAGNDHSNGGCQGNCSGGGSDVTANGGNGYGGDGGVGYGGSGGSGTGIGVGVGIGQGGSATGGEGGKGGSGGSGYGFGGSGGDGGNVVGSGNSANLNSNIAKGGSAEQSQAATSGSKSVAQMASENSLKNTVNASSANDNRSSASGNTTVTNVGGDSTLVERNAPPVFLGAITPTSCGGSIQAGASDRNGSGAFGFSWVGTECSIRMIGDRYQQLGMVDTACEVYRSTKAFQKAAKRNPKLAALDCSLKPEPAAVVVPVAPELAPRIPRG